MKSVSGVALKYEGGPIDYLSIFEWDTGDVYQTIKPNQNGEWIFNHTASLVCGITYIANDHKPLTHGPYLFEGVNFIKSGYIALVAVTKTPYDQYDVTNTGSPTWVSDFSQVVDIGLFNYKNIDAPVQFPYMQKTIEQFNPNWNIYIKSYLDEYNNNDLTVTFEILSQQDDVLFALKVGRVSDYTIGLWYGDSLSTLIKAPTGGAKNYTVVDGNLTFSPNSIVFTKSDIVGNYMIESFTKSANLSNADKIRVSTYADIKGVYDQAFCVMKIIS